MDDHGAEPDMYSEDEVVHTPSGVGNPFVDDVIEEDDDLDELMNGLTNGGAATKKRDATVLPTESISKQDPVADTPQTRRMEINESVPLNGERNGAMSARDEDQSGTIFMRPATPRGGGLTIALSEVGLSVNVRDRGGKTCKPLVHSVTGVIESGKCHAMMVRNAPHLSILTICNAETQLLLGCQHVDMKCTEQCHRTFQEQQTESWNNVTIIYHF